MSTRVCYLLVFTFCVTSIAACAGPQPAPVRTPAPSATPTPAPSSSGAAIVEMPAPEEGASPEWESAVELFRRANTLQFEGQLLDAVATYRHSIATYPIAETFTFLGWTYSWMGLYDLAIAEAKRAIELDPEYGNPYNDIGSYLIAIGELDEAIPWLKKAMSAKRYASPHFPHLNLAAIWARKGLWDEALSEYKTVLMLHPDHGIPPLPTFVMPETALVEQFVTPRGGPRLSAVSEVMASYIQAWNNYDATALMDRSSRPTVEAVKIQLLHLARAKLERSQMHLVDVETLYLGERTAILRTQFQAGPTTSSASYILVQDDGNWKVVSLTTTGPLEAGGDAPVNRCAPCSAATPGLKG